MEYKVIRAKRAKERRRYAPEFKQKVLRECEAGDQSVAAVAMLPGPVLIRHPLEYAAH